MVEWRCWWFNWFDQVLTLFNELVMGEWRRAPIRDESDTVEIKKKKRKEKNLMNLLSFALLLHGFYNKKM